MYMFNLAALKAEDIFSIEYHFNDESLDFEIRDPLEIEIIENMHIITDSEGCIFIIRPEWVYISIVKRYYKG